MKKFLTSFVLKFGGSIAALALVVTTLTSNATCTYFSYQDEMPENAKKLRKF
jgi:cyclic lactone autoinducer peptide